jgi:preprotein translocase subunit YajC
LAAAASGAAAHQKAPEEAMFITPAYAQGPAAGGSDMLVSLLPFIAIFVIMYFLILRPQQKRVKSHTEMVNNLRRGDTVVTNGGMIGKISKVLDNHEVEIEIADGVKIRQVKQMVTEVRTKGEPVKE